MAAAPIYSADDLLAKTGIPAPARPKALLQEQKSRPWRNMAKNTLQAKTRSWYDAEIRRVRWVTEQSNDNAMEKEFYERINRFFGKYNWWDFATAMGNDITLGQEIRDHDANQHIINVVN